MRFVSTYPCEFLGMVREKAGCNFFDLEIDLPMLRINQAPSFSSILRLIDREHQGLALFENDRLRKDILVFVRNGSGGLDRISDLSRSVPENCGRIVISSGMEGG